jgi:hypothetical protein
MNWGKFGRNILDILAAGFPLLTCGSIASAQRHELSGTAPKACMDILLLPAIFLSYPP